jgi:hypothetical protein
MIVGMTINQHKEITLNEFLNSEYVNSNFTVV